MKNHLLRRLFVFTILTFSFAATTQAQVRPYTATDSQVQILLSRIETKTDSFRRSINTALDSSSLNGTDSEDAIVSYISEFETATDSLKEKFDSRRSVDADVEDVLNRATSINQFMQNNKLTASAQSNWNYLRTDLNTLARYYAVSWNWTTAVTTSTTTSTRSYRATDATVQALLKRIETGTDVFKRSVDRALYRQNNTDTSSQASQYISDFETETDRLQQRFDSRQSVSTDVSGVLTRASAIDIFMRNNRLNTAAQRDWNLLKADLNTLAGYYDVSWNWTNPPVNTNDNTTVGGLPYRVSDTNVRTLLTRLETNTDNYRRQILLDIDRSALNNTRSEDSAVSYITDFENAVDKLKQNFESRRSATTDVDEVLNRAYYIDSFMRDYRFSTTTQAQWTAIRRDLDTLTNYYSATWDWNRQNPQMSRFDQMLNGTYRLNLNQSDNVAEVVQRATSTGYQTTQRDRISNNLERRLTPPDTLAIEKVGNQVTIASGNAQQVTFTADGTPKTETNNNGRSVKITATTTYDGVSLNYEGERMNDFYVNFIPMSNGQLRVVRRVYLENRNETVTVASVYDKVSPNAQWSQVNDNTTSGSLNNTFVIPNNTKMTATLTSPISTKTSQNGDRFQMEVTSPSQYDGAIIEGRVAKTERSGRVSGRAQVSLEFDTIRLRNGQTYRFAGFVDSVTLASGEKVTVNNEGTVRDNNQTTKTATRAGIGAAIGAIIGAIAGGGSGAAIGAGVGAGAGAGSVILQGRDDVELGNGTEFSITATAPANVSLNR